MQPDVHMGERPLLLPNIDGPEVQRCRVKAVQGAEENGKGKMGAKVHRFLCFRRWGPDGAEPRVDHCHGRRVAQGPDIMLASPHAAEVPS